MHDTGVLWGTWVCMAWYDMAWYGMAFNTLITLKGAAGVLRAFLLTSGYGCKGHRKSKATLGGLKDVCMRKTLSLLGIASCTQWMMH